tara:strand:- start:155 stop:664 length:510 start_codon:yes stop_codon:yes gene_type:complete
MKNIFVLFMVLSLVYTAPTKKIYNVEGMMCASGCAATINKKISSLNGIESVDVDFRSKQMEVVFDNTNIKPEDIIDSLPSPYKATLIKEIVTKEYMVGGMTCMGCVTNIQNSIDGLDGLENYDINIKKEMLFIEFDINKTDDKIILSQIPEKFKLVEIKLEENKENLKN